MHSPCSRCLLRWSYVRKEEHRLKIPSSSVFVCVNGDGLFLNHHFTHRQLTRRLIKRLRKEREKKRDSFRHVVTRAFLFAIMTHRTDRVLAKPPASHSNGRGNDFKEQVPMQIFLRHPSMSHMPHLQSTIQIELAYSTIIKHNKTITNTTK